MHVRSHSYIDLKELRKDLYKKRDELRVRSDAGYGLTTDAGKVEDIFVRMNEYADHPIHRRIEAVENEIERRLGERI